MAFWSDGKISPKLSYKWVLTLGGVNDPIAAYTLRSFQKPSYNLGVAEYLNFNDVAYRPGILSWNTVDANLVDAENTFENNTKILYSIMRKSGYVKDPRSAFHPATAIVKNRASANIGAGDSRYGGQVIFDQIDSSGKSIEQWILWNPFISKANFGQATYAADEMMTISVTIQYDFAEYRFGEN